MSKPTSVAIDQEALKFISKGVSMIYEPVRRTFGPDSGTTLMYRTYGRGPRNVDDGYYTAEVIIPKNPFVRLAAEFFKEGIKRTNERVGDGTTGTAILAGVLHQKIAKLLHSGWISADKVKKALKEEGEIVKKKIRECSTPVESLEDLKKISAISMGEQTSLSDTIAELAYKVGPDGFIDVTEGYKGEVETELVEGMRFPAKPCGKAFINKPERFEMVLEDYPVFITNQKFDSVAILIGLFKKFKTPKLAILAPDFSNEVLVSMVQSRETGAMIFPVKIPSLRTEQMDDIAVYCNATLIDKDKGMALKDAEPVDLGFLSKLIVKDAETREDAIALGGKGQVDVRVGVLKGQLEETREPQFKMLLRRRIASMTSSGAVIRVGSPTDAETLPLKLKIEDNVFACRAALRSGYVKGGGLCLKEISEGHEGYLKDVLDAPWKQIQDNTGGIEIGPEILDPTDAIYYAVEHAISIVSSLITVKTLVIEEEELQNGEGEMSVAKAINSLVLAWKKKEGILSENEALAYKDANPLSMEEKLLLDNG